MHQNNIIGMTLCSGIGAPEMAAPWVDWRFASEIEPFPRAVLQERFGYKTPDQQHQGDPLLWGDMTEVTPDLLRSRGIPLPDLIVAGTPCQAFSVAGARKGLADARGNLTLAFVEICHAIVDARPDGKLAILWENVPGVLSDRGNAFGCFLGGLVGALDALPPPGNGSWPSEGMVQGPRARAAWAVLDAQWFGVAQRRRRVFVVVDFGNCVDPAAVLLEPDRLRGDTPPRREAGQGAAAGAAQGVALRGRDGGATAELTGPVSTALRCGGGGGDKPHALIASTGDVAHCLNAGGMGRQDYETETMVAHTLKAEGFDASEDGTGRGTPLVPAVAGTMKACKESGGWSNSADHAAAGYMVPVAFTAKDYGGDAVENVSPTLRAGGHTGSHANAGVMPAVAWALGSHAGAADGDQTNRSHDGGGPVGLGVQEECSYSLRAGRTQNVATPWAVRRLTPIETARLQGLPDDHTAITYRGKPAADGPQYKAHGNSMAVPVIRWIMDRMRISMEDNA